MSKTMRSLHKQPSSPAPKSPLLISKSEKKYKRVRMALKNEVQPQSVIEKMYFADITQLNWDIERYRRVKTAILNTAFRAALATILEQVLTRPGDDDSDVDDKAAVLADQWFSDSAAKRRVSTLLAKYQLDGAAVEGQVMKDCAAELAALDRLLASASRADKRPSDCWPSTVRYCHGM